MQTPLSIRALISAELTQVALGLVGFDCVCPVVVQSIGSGAGPACCGALGGVLMGGSWLRLWFHCIMAEIQSQYSAASSVYSLKVFILGAVTRAS